MDTQQALLEAILDEPAEDIHRLVYADWCDENGAEERAAFIRVQVELARGDLACMGWFSSCEEDGFYGKALACDRCKRHFLLTRREKELLGGDFCRWSVRISSVTSECRRGFVADVKLTARDFVKHAGRIFAGQPVERVRLTDKRPLRFESGSGDHCYSWMLDPPRSIRPHHVPAAITRCWPATAMRHFWTNYRTEEAALDALSQACLNYGIQQRQKSRRRSPNRT
jgi:uncharacterized protein (TIGR02996 family)